MFNSNIIDVAIGLVFIFLLLSLICSAAHEIIEAFMKARAANLERGIQELAGNNSQEFVTKLYDHGLVNSLYKGKYAPVAKGFFRRLFQRYVHGPDLPSYIPSKNFALALIDLKNTGAELPQNIKDALQAFERVAGQNVAQLQQHIEEWYNTSMDRVSGWYKRRSQWIILVLGLACRHRRECGLHRYREAAIDRLQPEAVGRTHGGGRREDKSGQRHAYAD